MIWRVLAALAALAGLGLGGLWFLGSSLALGLAECPPEAQSGLCAPRHEDLLTALEMALVIGGTIVAVAGGLLSAHSRRPHRLVAPAVVLVVLSFCADLILAGHELPAG